MGGGCPALLLLAHTGLMDTVQAQGPTHRFVPELRYGAANQLMLTDVRSVAAGPDGAIALVTASGEPVIVFDNQGRFQRMVGRIGQGPGEYTEVTGIGWDGDTISVLSARNRRVTLFLSTGRHVGTLGVPTSSVAGRWISPQAVLTDGRLLGTEAGGAVSLDGKVAGEESPYEIRLFALPRDSVAAIRLLPSMFIRKQWIRIPLPGGAVAMQRLPWPQSDILAMASNGHKVILIHPGAPAVSWDGVFVVETIWVRTGRTSRFSVSYQPKAPQETEYRAWIDRQVEQRGSHFATRAEARRTFQAMAPMPKAVPPVRAAVVSRTADVWLQRGALGDSARWEAWTEEGHLARVIHLPQAWRIVEANGDVLWISAPEEDVPELMRARVVPLRPGGTRP